jgi:hypothetical protein
MRILLPVSPWRDNTSGRWSLPLLADDKPPVRKNRGLVLIAHDAPPVVFTYQRFARTSNTALPRNLT